MGGLQRWAWAGGEITEVGSGGGITEVGSGGGITEVGSGGGWGDHGGGLRPGGRSRRWAWAGGGYHGGGLTPPLQSWAPGEEAAEAPAWAWPFLTCRAGHWTQQVNPDLAQIMDL